MNDKLNLFFEYLTVELGLASNTRLAYERDLRLFKEALGLKDNDALATVSREQVIRYMTGLKNKGLAAATIARKLAAIKSFYRSYFILKKEKQRSSAVFQNIIVRASLAA